MKAILVIDMPKECFECPFRINDGYSSEDKSTWFTRRCHLSHDQVHENEILENCPLKPIPERKCEAIAINRKVRDLRFESGFCEETLGMKIDEYAKGFNACIDEILGEEQ